MYLQATVMYRLTFTSPCIAIMLGTMVTLLRRIRILVSNKKIFKKLPKKLFALQHRPEKANACIWYLMDPSV